MVLLCDFSHLESFSYSIKSRSNEHFLVNFSFSNHVFTDSAGIAHTPAHQFDDRGKGRAFDEQRYQDSLLLPNLLKNLLPSSKIYDERHGNVFYFPHVGFFYRIILSLRRERKQVAVLIETAHRVPVLPNLKQEAGMNFPIAVKRVYDNKIPLFK